MKNRGWRIDHHYFTPNLYYIESDRLLELLAQLNINPQARAEELSLSDWITLANALSQ